MPTVQENRAALPNAAALAQYSAIDSHLPEELHPKLQTFMRTIHEHMQEHPPENVDAVVAYTKASWKRPVLEVTLYTIGQAEERYDLLFEMAERLAGFYVEDVIANINPIRIEDWKRWVENKGAIYRHIKGRGIAVYDRADLQTA